MLDLTIKGRFIIMSLKLLSSAVLALTLTLTACSSVPYSQFKQHYQLKPQGETEQYCHKTYRYCVNIPALGDGDLITHLNDGFVLSHSSGYKMVIVGAKFDDKKADNPISQQQFIDEILPLSDVEKEHGWRAFSLDDGLKLRQGRTYLNDNKDYVESGHYHYHSWFYNKNGYVDMFVSYPADMQEEIKPVVEQVVNSMVLK